MMTDAHGYRLVYCTFPDEAAAKSAAATLVGERLAACCSVSSHPVQSVYSWQGMVERSTEFILTVKTHQRLLDRVESAIRSLHPYSVPEIISVQLCESSADYEAWMQSVLDKG
ncbi:MAG: divalent-cation tolerance protein CutA [Candidatus Kapabacteria bacterium]|nr:divalent-cation tolerance protein CutA [Candidatus Kapabacteria bacterium]